MDKKYLKEEEKSKEKLLLLNFSYPKLLRIRKSFEYRLFKLSKKRFEGTYINIDYSFNNTIISPRLGLTVSSKLAKANIRNRFKRIFKEIFRLNRHKLQNNLEINILPKFLSKNIAYLDIENDFNNFLKFLKN